MIFVGLRMDSAVDLIKLFVRSVEVIDLSLWRRANAQNVSFETLYGVQFTLSSQLIIIIIIIIIPNKM